jgi:hypothetical protein
MADERDPPIEEPGFIGGITVVDIGDVRVSRGLTRRHHASCPHRRLVYDNNERRVWCKDCERDVEPFDAFKSLVEQHASAVDTLRRREKVVADAEKFTMRRIAAKVMDEAWRSRDMVPACPHCSHGLFPEDFRSTPAMISKDYARARLGRVKEPA